jgi:undecaprenyl-diphosphatase
MNKGLLVVSTEWVVTFVASFLIWLMFFGLFFLWLKKGRINKELVLHALFACLIAWGFSEMVKALIPSLRPFKLNGYPPLTISIPIGHSFPSSHTAVSFALAFSLWLHDKKLGAFYILGALAVGLGRIMANVHSVIDIIGGVFFGIGTAYLIEKLHLHSLISSSGKSKK